VDKRVHVQYNNEQSFHSTTRNKHFTNPAQHTPLTIKFNLQPTRSTLTQRKTHSHAITREIQILKYRVEYRKYIDNNLLFIRQCDHKKNRPKTDPILLRINWFNKTFNKLQ